MSKRPYTAEYRVGFIQTKVDQLRKIVHRLENQHDFAKRELDHMRMEMMEIETEVLYQKKFYKDDRSGPRVKEFDQLYAMAEQLWEEQYTRVSVSKGTIPKTSGNSPAIQFGEVELAIHGNADQENLPPQEPRRRVIDTSLDDYATDNEKPLPVHCLSRVRPSPSYKPIEFPRPEELSRKQQEDEADLRAKLEQRRKHLCQPIESLSVSSKDSQPAPLYGGQYGRPKVSSQKSGQSFGAYVWSRQEIFAKPVSGRTYPPILTELPFQISRQDPEIIGMAEIYVRKPMPAQICPICPDSNHKLFRCATFKRSSLLERWFRALRVGVCLNCLTLGHSSFTCISGGACTRCQTRHNSKLCPQNPNNQ